MKTSTRHKNPLGDISVLYVAVMARALRAEGRDPTDLLSRFGLDEQALGAPAARISIPRFMRMGQAAIALTGNPALGLTMGQLSRPWTRVSQGLPPNLPPQLAKPSAR